METAVAPYDDPYQVLSIQLVVDLSLTEVCRLLYDDAYMERIIQKETRELDFYGKFLDCIVGEILANKRRMALMTELDKLGSWFFSNLDLERLRSQIKKDMDRLGISWRDNLPA